MNVYLKVPTLDDMKYRQAWMMDELTMSYNAGMNLDFSGYDYDKGTISKSDEEMELWYHKWINQTDRYFAYIYLDNVEEPIGEVYFYKDGNYYSMGILIINKYRGLNLSEGALKELLKVAFMDYKINELRDSFPDSRVRAIRLFKKCGFKESKVSSMEIFNEPVSVVELVINRDNYLNAL